MANRGRPQRHGKPSRPARPSPRTQNQRAQNQRAKGERTARPAAGAEGRPDSEEPRTFRLGAVPGATPGRWIDTWKRRMPHVELELVAIDAATQRAAINELDAALIRL